MPFVRISLPKKLSQETKNTISESIHHSLIEEFNIGHAIVCQAAIVGLDQAIRQMISSIEAP